MNMKNVLDESLSHLESKGELRQGDDMGCFRKAADDSEDGGGTIGPW